MFGAGSGLEPASEAVLELGLRFARKLSDQLLPLHLHPELEHLERGAQALGGTGGATSRSAARPLNPTWLATMAAREAP